MSCRTGCKTPGEHLSWGECARAAHLRIGYCRSAAGYDLTAEKRKDAELDAYERAVDSGMNPEGTTWARIREAEQLSEMAGVGYGTPEFEAKAKAAAQEMIE